MMKKLKIGALVAIITFAGIFLVTSIYLDSIVKSAIQEFGPEILQVPVNVDNVALSPLTGSGTIEGLIIGNPEGFDSEYLIDIGLLSVDVAVISLLSDHIKIEDLLMQNMHVYYERNSGTSNVAALEQLMAADTSPEGGAQSMTINHMVIEESRVTLQTSMLGGKSVTITIPKTEHEQISSESTTVGKTVKIILEPVLQSIKNAGTKALQKPGNLKVKDKVKGLFNKN